MNRRRDFIATSFIAIAPTTWRTLAFGQSQSKVGAPVLWGGLGYTVAHGDIPARFPLVSKAAELNGWANLVSAFTGSLQKNYPGGVVQDPVKMLSSKDDPSLLFTVSLDYEQMILVPNDGGNGEFQLSFIYALAQVLYLEVPRDGGTDGSIRVVYSFPFRVQSGETPRVNNRADQIQNFQKLLLTLDNSLVNVFSRKVASKRFKEGKYPKVLKVASVTVSPDAEGTFKGLGIHELLSGAFFGQAFTASLAEKGEMSVMPYVANSMIGELSRRFDRYPRIEKIFDRYSKSSELDYAVDLTIFKALRQSNGGNVGNVLYARGLSVLVKVTNVISGKVVFDKKILLIENNELPRAMMDRLKDYDLRYLVQIAIKLFDNFVTAVVKEDATGLKSVGLDPDKDMGDAKALKQLWLECRV
jgi:hypothetical protein